MTDDERKDLYEAGKAKMAEVAARAKEEARKALEAKAGGYVEATSERGQFALAGLTEDAIESLMIYEDGPGRWYADVGIRPRFEGQPDIMGTPTSMPLPSRDEAERQGYALLCMLLEEAIRQDLEAQKQMKKDLADSQIFSFGDIGMGIPQRLIDDVIESLDRTPGPVRERLLAKAEKELEETIIEVAGNEIMTMEALEAASHEKKHRLALLAAMMIIQDKPQYTPGVGQPRM